VGVLGHGVADEELAAVGHVGLGDGVKEAGQVQGGLADGVGVTASAAGQVGDDQELFGQGQGGDGGGGEGNLSGGQGVGGRAQGQGQGVRGHDQGQAGGGDSQEKAQLAHDEGCGGDRLKNSVKREKVVEDAKASSRSSKRFGRDQFGTPS